MFAFFLQDASPFPLYLLESHLHLGGPPQGAWAPWRLLGWPQPPGTLLKSWGTLCSSANINVWQSEKLGVPSHGPVIRRPPLCALCRPSLIYLFSEALTGIPYVMDQLKCHLLLRLHYSLPTYFSFCKVDIYSVLLPLSTVILEPNQSLTKYVAFAMF